jgi:hypothetical protein
MLSTESRTQPRTKSFTAEVTNGRVEEVTPLPMARTDTKQWLRESIDGRLGLAVGIGWVVLMQIAFALEPQSNQAVPVIGLLLEITMYLLLATMAAGLIMQRRFGLVASLGGAVLATAASIACPVTGHHPFGTWWFGQMACVLALVGISVAAIHWSNASRAIPERR